MDNIAVLTLCNIFVTEPQRWGYYWNKQWVIHFKMVLLFKLFNTVVAKFAKIFILDKSILYIYESIMDLSLQIFSPVRTILHQSRTWNTCR